jgi:phosphoglucosamine mutase
MGRYFGTDGVRGKANETLTVGMAYKVGRYLGYYFNQHQKARIVIGKDTRLSSTMFETAIITGCLESGADVYVCGYTSTPNISYLTKQEQFDCGIMISASHNPYYDNGIKVFKQDGTKISAELEALIEDYFDGDVNLPKAVNEHVGRLYEYHLGIEHYLDALKAIVHKNIGQLKIALDLANGSACYTAPLLFQQLGVEVDIFFNQPDGVNINTGCGSTHLEPLKKIVLDGKYDVGFAFDGDADRMLCVNHLGEVVDGDMIMYFCSRYLQEQGMLNEDTLVTTVMSNIGLHRACRNAGIKVISTAVGDKYVYECMEKHNYSFGGEQSGHLIFKKFANTGDGLLSALLVMEVMLAKQQNLVELCQGLKIFPQLLVNVKVKDKQIINDADIQQAVSQVENALQDNGRILVRTSGTEQLIRVMVEAENDELCAKYVQQVVEIIKNKQ